MSYSKMSSAKMSPVARSARMTIAFYSAHAEPGLVPLEGASGGAAPARVFDFRKPGGVPGAVYDDWMKVYIPDPNFEQPPVRLEARNGLRGIAHHYRLPEGLSAEEIQTYACIVYRQEHTGRLSPKEADGRLKRLYRALERLNPALRALDFDRQDPHKISDAVWGVASAFNPKDIQFFLAGNTWASANENENYAARIERLGPKLEEGYIGWVAAPGTLTEIWRQVRHRGTEKPSKPAQVTPKAADPKPPG